MCITFADFVPRLRKLAADTLENQLSQCRRQLSTMLVDDKSMSYDAYRLQRSSSFYLSFTENSISCSQCNALVCISIGFTKIYYLTKSFSVFTDLHIPARHEDCLKCLNGCMMELEQISGIWKGVCLFSFFSFETVNQKNFALVVFFF